MTFLVNDTWKHFRKKQSFVALKCKERELFVSKRSRVYISFDLNIKVSHGKRLVIKIKSVKLKLTIKEIKNFWLVIKLVICIL